MESPIGYRTPYADAHTRVRTHTQRASRVVQDTYLSSELDYIIRGLLPVGFHLNHRGDIHTLATEHINTQEERKIHAVIIVVCARVYSPLFSQLKARKPVLVRELLEKGSFLRCVVRARCPVCACVTSCTFLPPPPPSLFPPF